MKKAIRVITGCHRLEHCRPLSALLIRTTWILILMTIAINNCKAAKILGIFPTPSFSHQQPCLALSRALAAKGHNLTVITANPSKEPLENHREIDISYAYAEWRRVQEAQGVSLQHRISTATIVGDMNNFLTFFTSLAFNSPNVINFIKEVNGTKFDLILCESLFYSSLLGFREITGNPPVIGIATLNPLVLTDTPQGNPIIPSYIPHSFLPFSDDMTLYERFYNLFIQLYSFYIMEFHMKPTQQDFLTRYFGDVKRTAEQLENDKSLVFASSDLATGYPKPTQPNTIYVGPMHIVKPEPLVKDLQKWIDESEEGVIYFSLGSNMQGTSVPEEIRAAFIKAFTQFPKVRVLWKWEADTKLPGQPDNVLVKKWLPQQSILAHPKIRLFISQVGLQSFQEATYYGVPILAIPMFADQDFNAKKLVKEGAGLSLEFTELSYESIYEKLNALLTDKSYKENMLRLSKITKDKPMTPVETAIWWTEYILRHNGAPHLRPAAIDLTWCQYYMVDILIVITILSLIVSVFIYFIYRTLIGSYKSGKLKRN